MLICFKQLSHVSNAPSINFDLNYSFHTLYTSGIGLLINFEIASLLTSFSKWNTIFQ